jgi:hypothetical protein
MKKIKLQRLTELMLYMFNDNHEYDVVVPSVIEILADLDFLNLERIDLDPDIKEGSGS